jgi:predicted TIM-barrel fold metal-dependent hydrolase
MDQVGPAGITRGLVWHVAQRDYSASNGNRMLSEAISGASSLVGCWTVLPPQTGEVDSEKLFDGMKSSRVFALRAFPERHQYILRKAAFGGLLEQIAERRIPLLLSLAHGGSWQVIHDALQDVPELTCVVCDLGVWGVNRYTWPLLDRYPNVYLETSFLSLAAGGLESTVSRFGADRLLFGTGFPERYPQATALQLLHTDISENDRKKVASGNLERLIGEVRL